MEHNEVQSAKQRIFSEAKIQAIRPGVTLYLEQTARYQISLMAA